MAGCHARTHLTASTSWPSSPPPTGDQFMKNITLWWTCLWTLSVATVQAGGLDM
jgi:hypothetical protein